MDLVYLLIADAIGRNLDKDEWHRFIGEDISYEPTYQILPASE